MPNGREYHCATPSEEGGKIGGVEPSVKRYSVRQSSPLNETACLVLKVSGTCNIKLRVLRNSFKGAQEPADSFLWGQAAEEQKSWTHRRRDRLKRAVHAGGWRWNDAELFFGTSSLDHACSQKMTDGQSQYFSAHPDFVAEALQCSE
jgi:hypothetical protein